jgi:polar amino acid transport system substrate-binding protein
MRFFFAALVGLALGVVVAPARADPPSALARVRASGALRWGGDLQGGEPFVSIDPAHAGALVGFEVDIADALAKRLGVRAEFHQNDWSQLVPSLERETFDIVLNGLEVTRALQGRVTFSRPYYVFAERLMARKDDPSVTGLDSLASRRAGTLTNSLAHEILASPSPKAPVVVFYEGVEEPYIDLARGRIDAVLLDDLIATRYGVPHRDLRVVSDVATGYYAVATLPSQVDLSRAIDGAMADLIASGDLERILRKASLWNPREERLVEPTSEERTATLVPSPQSSSPSTSRARGMSWLDLRLFLEAAGVTLLVSTLAMGIAIPLGLALAILRRYGPRWAARFSSAYVEIYRGTPVLLQLYVLYYGLASVVRLGALTTAVLGLGMNYGAYEAEVYRAGIQAVPEGQMAAATALGMSTPLALRRIVLPQALRLALPNVTNDFIALLKDSSLVSVITVVELTKQMTITAVDVRSFVLPGLLCAALYFAMSYPLSRWARALEGRLGRA